MTKLNWDRERIERLIRKAGTINFNLDTPPLVSNETFPARPSKIQTRTIADTAEIRELKTFLLELFERELTKIEASAVVDLFSPDDLFELNRSLYEAADKMSLWVGRTPIADVKARFDKSSPVELLIVTLIMKRGIKK